MSNSTVGAMPPKGMAYRCEHSSPRCSATAHRAVGAERAYIGRPPKEPAAGMRSISIVVTLLLAGILLWSILSIRAIPSSQTLQYEAERWQGPSDQTYSQVSVFWNEGEMDAGQAKTLAEELQTSFPTEEIPPFVTAYGAKSSGLAVYAHRSTEAELWSVSRDFFTLHAFSMAEGGPGTFADTGSEAVLNEAAAFALFGSSDCIGEDIQISGLGWRVIAVIREPEGAANEAAFGTAPRIFLPIADNDPVTFYEAILPEYYTGYAVQCLQNATGRTVTSSTGRFRLSRLWEQARNFFRTPPDQTPPLPPWEQAARLAERKLCARWCVLVATSVLLLCQLSIILFQVLFQKNRLGCISSDNIAFSF